MVAVLRDSLVLAALGLLAASPASAAEQCDTGNDGSCTVQKAEYFSNIPRIRYEGPASRNPLAYRYYNANEVVYGKAMKDWLRFAVAFWHSMRNDGTDVFGSGTRVWPWEDAAMTAVDQAKKRLDAFFELLDKLGVEFWCFHDRDIAPEGIDLKESNAMLQQVAAHAETLQQHSGKRVLWGTAQLFKHPRYMHGAATSPNASVFAYAAAQVKQAMDVSKRLGASAYVLWGGREGYHTLRNTDLKLELDNMAHFMQLVVDYNKRSGFNAQLLLEPKPQEPTKHQYDYDAATTVSFLRQYGLDQDFKLNIECNHATLAGHSCEHELAMSSSWGVLGALDANTGDPQTGWDTDQFLTDVTEATLLMTIVLKQGGFDKGGINFDAKLRRESTDPEDLFLAHIGGMDALARGLRNAAKLLEEGVIPHLIKQRYSSWQEGLGLKIRGGKMKLETLEAEALGAPDPAEDLPSGKAELHDMLLSMYVQ